MQKDTLAELIARTALKDRQAFRALYAATSPKLFAICIRILKDRSDAEDALQDIYMKIWQRADRLDAGRDSASAWLSAIARNHAIDILRARKPDHDLLDDDAPIAAPGPSPESAAVAGSERRRIDICMQQLESDRAQAVTKAYVEGLSYSELAEHYGVPLNTMRTWLRRSLLKLRECMQS